MYGIMTQDGTMILCHHLTQENTYVMKRWDRNGNPVMRESTTEIDNLMQQYMVAANKYDLQVFQYTRDQEERILLRKLQGY